MTSVNLRTRPLVAVLARVPLFVEAMAGAFEGIADVQPIAAEDGAAAGLLRALRPDAIVAEGVAADALPDGIPGVRVDLEAQRVELRRDGVWQTLDIDASPGAIRNAAVAALYGGEVA